MLKPSFIILSGDGINCENETRFALETAGASTEIVHINSLVSNPSKLKEFQGMIIPGGFSFGDDLGSGKVLALKMKKHLDVALDDFCSEGKPILGICNGFQVLVKLGLLPSFGQDLNSQSKQQVTLTNNIQSQFINKWVELEKEINCKSPWLKDIENIKLPIRHAEGRVVLGEDLNYQTLLEQGYVALSYKNDVNGSEQKIAGLCDKSGLILGLMPHPEAAIYNATEVSISESPYNKSDGYKLFKNIVNFLSK